MTIKYILQSKNNPSVIYIRMSITRNYSIKAKTNYFINPTDWNTNKSLPKDKDENCKSISEKLLVLKTDITKEFNKLKPNELINIQWLKDIITPPPPPQPIEEKPTDLLNYFISYIKEKQAEATNNKIKQSTVRRLTSTKNLIEKYEKNIKQVTLIKDIDNNFQNEFENYCIKKNYAPNTISKAIKQIKTVCKNANFNGLETNTKLEAIKTKYLKVDHVYLTFDELEQIEQTDFSSTDYLDNAKDWLIISCYTGQRVSDFMRFNKDMIRIENGKHLIEFTQTKTNKIMTLPLHKKVLSILEKRNGSFPRAISDQKYNDYIKEVCKIAGLTQKIQGSLKNPDTNRKENGIFEKWELVSSHIGRRSFASNHYGKIPTSLLISATGHSTETMFLAYIGKSNADKAKELADYF